MNELTKRMGSLDLDKGEARPGHKMFAWDAVQDCADDNCPIVSQCAYNKEGKCVVQLRYVETILTTILNTYKYLDDVQLTKIGIQIIPLYSQLARLKIIEKSITIDNIVNVSKHGMYVHPVFKEIRQTLLMINQMWRDLLIKPINLMTPDPDDPDSSLNGDNDPRVVEGDPSYYKTLSEKSHLRRKGVR